MTFPATMATLPLIPLAESWAADPRRHCADADPEEFFPLAENSKDAERAIAMCEHCPVRRPCLDYAVRTHQWGIWGGTTRFQRSKIRIESGLARVRAKSTKETS